MTGRRRRARTLRQAGDGYTTNKKVSLSKLPKGPGPGATGRPKEFQIEQLLPSELMPARSQRADAGRVVDRSNHEAGNSTPLGPKTPHLAGRQNSGQLLDVRMTRPAVMSARRPPSMAGRPFTKT